MAHYSREEVLAKVKRGESLERVDLTDLALDQANFESTNLRRADLAGVDLEGSNLKQANLSSSNLCEAYLVGANLEEANLQKADLEGANLQNANLQCADLSFANLEGASLEGANLKGARLLHAQLELANLGAAFLDGAELTQANLCESYLGGARLIKANLQHARMEKINLEEADLTGAILTGASLHHAYGEGANFTGALLEGTSFENATLTGANLSKADLRHSNLLEAKLPKAILTAAKLFGVKAYPDQLAEVLADWIDLSAEGNGQLKVGGAELAEYWRGMSESFVGVSGVLSHSPKRFFGPGDVLRNATLEFSEKSQVEVESRFEKCTITLGAGATLTIGPQGVLAGCQIIGAGGIVVHGRFYENGKRHGMVGPSQLIVGKTGTVIATVQQPLTLTQFGFEHGCSLGLRILKSQ
jgi:uncharacterized protein YjbI with pentapeptide repeats